MKKIVAKVGQYTNSQGEQKNQWLDIGVILENANGEYVMLNPTVDLSGVLMKQRLLAQKSGGKSGDNVLCSIFADDKQQGGQRQAPAQQQAPQGAANFDDDIPF